MNEIKEIVQRHYGLKVSHLSPQKGGWAALAYKVIAEGQTYFLKIYEKSRASTPKWTALIDDYVPLLLWLQEHSALQGKIPEPLPTKSGGYRCENEEGIFLLYAYIEGDTIGPAELTDDQVAQLADIVAELHAYGEEVPVPAKRIKEDFAVPFLEPLKQVLDGRYPNVPTDVAEVLRSYVRPLSALIDTVDRLSREWKDQPLRYALCHTDLHNWNLMVSDGKLILIDWEGLRLAPVEADLMFVADEPYIEAFLGAYRRRHPEFALNPHLLQFYQGRRRLEDIWEWSEQLIHDPQQAHERADALNSLVKELQEMPLPLRN
ncbi:phosphotransferase enzyme family protein [Paenibacillus hodogayensis]|uniref:Phosphotransferase enzyme family protein n=1 Tax=Paenibacillus hodogayensis TaxID=279208 RepID=A0ABV5W362_9BACL